MATTNAACEDLAQLFRKAAAVFNVDSEAGLRGPEERQRNWIVSGTKMTSVGSDDGPRAFAESSSFNRLSFAPSTSQCSYQIESHRMQSENAVAGTGAHLGYYFIQKAAQGPVYTFRALCNSRFGFGRVMLTVEAVAAREDDVLALTHGQCTESQP